jgi:hypothetical protein
MKTKSGALDIVAVNTILEKILDALGHAKAAQTKNH